jgi:outer membrane protein TolC
MVAVRMLSGVGFLIWAAEARADDPSAVVPLTLSAAVETALADNADLKSLRAKWEAMQERPAQAGALPNPMFTFSGMDMVNGGTWPDTNEKRFMVQQEFPWFGKRGLREGLAARDAEIMRHEWEAMAQEVVMRVKESYFDLYAVQRVIAIARDEEAVIRRMEKVAETLYATGERAQVDVIKAQAEISMLKQKLLELESQEAILKARLNTLFNRRADEPLGTPVTPPDTAYVTNTLPTFVATNRPEVQAAQAQFERAALERTLMAKDFLPDYKLGLEYRDFGNSENMAMVSISVDLPIWQSRIRAGVREAEKMRVSSQAAREAAERQSALEAQDAFFKLQAARQTLALTRTEIIPQAEARFNASEAGYRAGKVDFMDLLESERFLLNVKTMAAMTEGAVGMQAARLERALGTDVCVMPNGAVSRGEP